VNKERGDKMKNLVFYLALIGPFFLLIFGFGYSWSHSAKTQMSENENLVSNDYASPPSSLDNLYPPNKNEPIYLFKMFELGTFFSGIVADLFENDSQNAKDNFEKFKTKYIEVSKLVPEWEKEYLMGPLNELKIALDTGTQGKVMAAIEKVGQTCHQCHVSNMAKVQQKYHWGDFETIKIKDPLKEEEVSFTQLKQGLNVNFVAIGLNIEQGQKENARKQLQAFKARFQTLKSICQNCHKKEEIKHYVDQTIFSLIENIELELGRSAHDPNVVSSLTQKIGMESCFKCHLVHIPSAFAKLQWKK
jgi:cytochrome c556